MSYRRHPFSDSAFDEINRLKTRPALPKGMAAQAREHEYNRDDAVGHILAHLHMMAVKKLIVPQRNPIFTIVGAALQSVHSSGENQAAHRVPGQILITGRSPGSILLERDLVAAARVNLLFAITDDLDAIFNKVDSQLEPRGLKRAFLDASRFVVTRGYGLPRADPRVVEEGWATYYKDQAMPAYESVLGLYSNDLAPASRESSELKLGITEEERDYLRRNTPEGVEPAMVRNIEMAYEVAA